MLYSGYFLFCLEDNEFGGGVYSILHRIFKSSQFSHISFKFVPHYFVTFPKAMNQKSSDFILSIISVDWFGNFTDTKKYVSNKGIETVTKVGAY